MMSFQSCGSVCVPPPFEASAPCPAHTHNTPTHTPISHEIIQPSSNRFRNYLVSIHIVFFKIDHTPPVSGILAFASTRCTWIKIPRPRRKYIEAKQTLTRPLHRQRQTTRALSDTCHSSPGVHCTLLVCVSFDFSILMLII